MIYNYELSDKSKADIFFRPDIMSLDRDEFEKKFDATIGPAVLIDGPKVEAAQAAYEKFLRDHVSPLERRADILVWTKRILIFVMVPWSFFSCGILAGTLSLVTVFLLNNRLEQYAVDARGTSIVRHAYAEYGRYIKYWQIIGDQSPDWSEESLKNAMIDGVMNRLANPDS